MSVDLKNLLISQINELDPEIDTSVGSNFRDLLINPISTLFSSYQGDHEKVMSTLSITDPTLFSEDELDAVASNFLIERNEGAYHVGEIQLFFSEPRALVIPANSRFRYEATGAQYETISNYTSTRSSLSEEPTVGGLYPTAPIKVRSVNRSTDGSLNSGALLKSLTFKTPAPRRVQVTSPITGGSQRESNEALYERLLDSVKTSTLASTGVIENSVASFYPQVKEVKVIGAGDSLMIRDLISYDPIVENIIEDFKLVVPGESEQDYSKEHEAYWAVFPSEEVTNNGTSDDPIIPTDLTRWDNEFDINQYKGIYTTDDSREATRDPHEILDVGIWSPDTLEDFELNDGSTANNNLIFPDEIRVEGNNLILGKTPTIENKVDVRLSLEEVLQLRDDLSQVEEDPSDGSTQLLKSLKAQIESKSDLEVYANVAPILHKDIGLNTGLEINVSIETSDSSENGEISYITVLRNDSIYMAHDGYGIAWRKQPEFLTRLNTDNYEDDDLREKDIAQFEDYFGVNPEDEGLVGNNTLRDGEGNDKYWLFNLYLVDNNVLSEDVQMGTNKVFDSINGINQYLQRSKYWIEKETSYDFKLRIDKNLATKAWVKPSSEASYDLKIDKGVTYPEYVPSAGVKVSSDDSQVEALDATRGHFGVSVGNTRGYEWAVSDLSIRRTNEIYLSHLFKFKVDTDKWDSPLAPFDLTYVGAGEGTGTSTGVELFIWNPDLIQWESIGSHLNGSTDTTENKTITQNFSQLGDYQDGHSSMYICAIPNNTDNTDHVLRSNFISLSNPQAGQKSIGNALDVYCHDPENIQVDTINTTISLSGEIFINEPYIQDFVELREANSQQELDPSTYRIHNEAYGESFGPDNSYKITFSDEGAAGTEITVVFRKWGEGSQVGAYLNDPENRYPAVSSKEKTMPPAVVFLSGITYEGDMDEEEVILSLSRYINDLEGDTLSKSGIINHLSSLGLENINTDFTLDVKQYYTNFNNVLIEDTNDTYKIPNSTVSRFYSNPDNIIDITNV